MRLGLFLIFTDNLLLNKFDDGIVAVVGIGKSMDEKDG